MSLNEITTSSSSFPKLMKESSRLYRTGKRKFLDGDYQSALAHFDKAVSMQEVLYGKYHGQTIKSYWWKGKAACKSKNDILALKSFQRATRMGQSAFDDASYKAMLEDIDSTWRQDHPTGDILNQMTKIFGYERRGDKAFKGGNFAKAIKSYCQALSAQDSLVGSDSLDGADIRCKLAISLIKTSAEVEAHRTLKLAHDCYVTQLGNEHPATLGATARMENITSAAA